MSSSASIRPLRVTHVGPNATADAEDQVAVEAPLQIRVCDTEVHTVSLTMRTPGDDADLAVGFLFTEGILRHRQDAANVHLADNVAEITLRKGLKLDLKRQERHSYTSSSCGVCGKTSLEALRMDAPPGQRDTLQVSTRFLSGLSLAARERQASFLATGGMHASALFGIDGDHLLIREDVGRHNALDKLIGAAFLAELLPLSSHVLWLSGRISFELVQKAAMAGIHIIVAVGAPSTLAVDLAVEHNMTLIGFLREERFNIYCGAARIRTE